MDKIKINNPFLLSGYTDPLLFCDRKKETEKLIYNAINGINSTLLSIRRMGKTGLLLHSIHTLHQQRKGVGIYVDIYDTENLKDFTNSFASAILKAFPEKHRFWKSTMDFLKQLRPVISFDDLSGTPEVKLDYSQTKQFEHSLISILNYLEKQNKPILVAIDEFQQIGNYPEKNMEAILRSHIQRLKNVKFIFSGSSPHMLSQMFHHPNRPFFASTQTLFLESIDASEYALFIKKQFLKYQLKIDDESIDFILKFTLQHTFYTQILCNKLFASGIKNIHIEGTREAAYDLLVQNEAVFFQYRNMLTSNQWNMLKAIANEVTLYKPNAKEIIHKYRLGSPSSIQRTLESLLANEMIFKMTDSTGSYYRVYDCFLLRWLERNY